MNQFPPATGSNGTNGKNGPSIPGLDGADSDEPLVIPGPRGIAGAAGANGTIGRDGLGVPGMDGMDGEDAIMIPGQKGAAGISSGFKYNFTSTVITNPTDDPGVGNVAFNDGSFMSSVTRINIYGTSVDGMVNFSWLANEVGIGSLLMLTSLTDSNRYGQFLITSLSQNVSWVSLVVTYSTSSIDIFDNNESLNLNIINKGDAGTNGTNGRNGITVVMEPELPDDPIVIPGPAGASGGAVPAANSVTRAMLSSTAVTGGKNWVFLGQGTASAATSTGTITWAGTFKQLMVEYFIAGYAGNGIGRILVANSGTPSPTATTCCTSIIVGVTAAPATPVSNSGWPTAIAAGLVPRYGWLHVSNISGVVKRATGHGQYGGTAPTTVPTQVRIEGMSSQTTLIQTLVMTSYTLATGNVIGGTMNAGTFVNVWGRNDD
jgi:hypothetical protein